MWNIKDCSKGLLCFTVFAILTSLKKLINANEIIALNYGVYRLLEILMLKLNLKLRPAFSITLDYQ